MSVILPDFSLGRQRSRQWIPLITQQLRLRHLYQILAFNLQPRQRGNKFYFTLHLTSMSSPFYTSQTIESFNPKWPEINLININMSCRSVVVRIWLKNDPNDTVVTTYGVNLTGLVYLGNKISEIQPKYFDKCAVIFFLNGGYFTSHEFVKYNFPNVKTLNVVDTVGSSRLVYRRVAVKCHKNDIQGGYSLEKLRKLQFLQLQLKNRLEDVKNVKESIEKEKYSCNTDNMKYKIGYSQHLLTMHSLNKMLHEKPTKQQRIEMSKLSKDIELSKFKLKILQSERDKKFVNIRQLKSKYVNVVNENEEKSSILMENYHNLSKEHEKLKEFKKNLFQHKEYYCQTNLQLMQRRRQLLQELLFLFPIKKTVDNKYSILDIHLPMSDMLADCNDTGLSVALGYVTHILSMSATIIQVPLRYNMTHYGSRSYVTDHIPPFWNDRDFPLFTRGKDKMQFIYAVYLLNKNLAQFRWYLGLHTNDLRATLCNLLSFLQGGREIRQSNAPMLSTTFDFNINESKTTINNSTLSLPSLTNFNDPILDFIRKETFTKRSKSPKMSKRDVKITKHKEIGRGLSEILAVPEAYLNKQITTDSLRNFIESDRFTKENGVSTNDKMSVETKNNDTIEEGTDPLEHSINITSTISKSIKISSDLQLRLKNDSDYNLKQCKRLSRSVGSYTDDESTFLRADFELGSEPLLNISSHNSSIENWLENGTNINVATSSNEEITSSPLTVRTDKLVANKSFNLVKPK